MITSSTAPWIASVIARKSSISYEGTPSGVRAWMWIIDAPSSTARRASSPYSSGVYGIAGHWSRLATAPLIELVITTGSLKLMLLLVWSRRRARLAEVVALACEFPARGGDLRDRRRLGEGADEPLGAGLVAGLQRRDRLLRLACDLPHARDELLVRVADVGGRVEALELGGERAGPLEPLLECGALLLRRGVRRRVDRRSALEALDNRP